MKFRLTLLAATLALCALQVNAQALYRWTDAQGNVHYTDATPPAGAKDVRMVTTDSAADSRAADNLREQNDALKQRAADRAKSPEDRAKEQREADRKARCGQLLAVLNAFDRGDPVFRTGEKGERIELSKSDKDFEKVRTGQQFQMECGDLAQSSLQNAARAATTSANSAASAASGGSAQRAQSGGGSSASGQQGAPASTAAPSGQR